MSADTPNTVKAVIPAGASESQAIDFGDVVRAHHLEIDGLDGTGMTLLTSYDGVDWRPVYQDTSEYVMTAAAAGRAVMVDQEVAYGLRRLKLRAGTAAAPNVQAAERAIRIVKAPR